MRTRLTPELRWAVFGAAGVALLIALCVARFRVTTDITHFLPGGREDIELALARQLAFGELSRTSVLIVRAGDGELAPRVSRDFERELRADPRVAERIAFLDAGPQPGVERALWELYEPRRLSFVARDAVRAAERVSDDGLVAAAIALRERLTLPTSALESRVAPSDPLLALPRLFDALDQARGTRLAVADGRFVVDEGQSAVLFIGSRAASSDNAEQRPLVAGIEAAFERVDAEHGGRLELEAAGANRYGLAMERSMQRDIQRVSVGSMVLLAALFLAVFGSLRSFLLALPVLGTGFAAGLAACLALFGSVHGLTLAFGSALIGVSVDYVVHFHAHREIAPRPDGPSATMRAIRPGLVLGAATTVAGFLALAVSSFPGLRELALFAATGITAALIAAHAFLPYLAGDGARPRRAVALARWLRSLAVPPQAQPARVARVVAVLAMLAVLAVGLSRARWDDGLAGLNRLDPELRAEERAVRERVVRFDPTAIAVAVAQNEQAALQINDRIADELERAQSEGLVGGSWSAATLLPSVARQFEVERAVRTSPELWERFQRAFEGAGFVPAAFEPFRAALVAPGQEALRPSDFEGTPLAPLLRPFVVHLDDPAASHGSGAAPPQAFVSYMHGVRDEVELRRRIEGAGGHLIDVEAEFGAAYGAYRARMLLLCSVGLVFVVLLVLTRQAWARHPAGVARATMLACAPALLACASTVALLALCGQSLNLLSLVALLMVASMGVDYGIFFAESAHSPDDFEATCLSVFLAALSTVFGFGLLALSDQPVLRSIGLSAGIGVALAWVYVVAMRRWIVAARCAPQ